MGKACTTKLSLQVPDVPPLDERGRGGAQAEYRFGIRGNLRFLSGHCTAPPPPLFCESHARVRATAGVVSLQTALHLKVQRYKASLPVVSPHLRPARLTLPLKRPGFDH